MPWFRSKSWQGQFHHLPFLIQRGTPPKTNMEPENRPGPTRKLIFQPSISRCEVLVSGRVCSNWHIYILCILLMEHVKSRILLLLMRQRICWQTLWFPAASFPRSNYIVYTSQNGQEASARKLSGREVLVQPSFFRCYDSFKESSFGIAPPQGQLAWRGPSLLVDWKRMLPQMARPISKLFEGDPWSYDA